VDVWDVVVVVVVVLPLLFLRWRGLVIVVELRLEKTTRGFNKDNNSFRVTHSKLKFHNIRDIR